MGWSFKSQKKYALVGLANQTMFMEQVGGILLTSESVKAVSTVQQGISEGNLLNTLFAGQRLVKGEIYISLPLNNFEVVNLTISKIPDEAVAKVLPFHLEKALEESVADFIYDWQITKRKKDSLAVSVILFPLAAYHRISYDCKELKLVCKSLEPDIYSAVAYLESNNRISAADVNIIMILHDSSISIGVYEKDKFTMIRPIILPQPDEPFVPFKSEVENDLLVNSNAADKQSEEIDLTSSNVFENSQGADDILADFLIPTKQNDELDIEDDEIEDDADDVLADPWQEYFDQVRLELMRTRDYYHSMIKGESISKVFVGCRAELYTDIKPIIEEFVEIQVEDLLEQVANSKQIDISLALGMGVLS